MNDISFPMGHIVATPGVIEVLSLPEINQLLVRHQCGDWGDLCSEDQQSNERALKQGARLFSAYNGSNETRLWIITEADRTVTTILLPQEY